MLSDLIQYPRMRHVYRLVLLCAGGSLLLLTGCATGKVAGGSSYHVTAYKPHDPSKVKVKLSTSTQNLYVMEGDRLLMAAQANVGKPGAPTPHGNFTIYSKQKERRRQSEPDRGYPMAYWLLSLFTTVVAIPGLVLLLWMMKRFPLGDRTAPPGEELATAESE